MNYNSNFITQRSVRPFCNAVLLWRVGGYGIVFSTMQASELMKFTIDVLTSVVSLDSFLVQFGSQRNSRILQSSRNICPSVSSDIGMSSYYNHQ